MTPSKKPERYCDSMEVTLFNRGWNAAIDATTPPAQPAPVQEPVAQCTVDVSGAAGPSCEPLNWHKTAAQPAVPDAMTSADIQEHIEYVAGWNDCRQAMLEMMK